MRALSGRTRPEKVRSCVHGVALAALLTLVPGAADAGEAEELRCLALTIYHEARGEPQRGRLAVGHVVMNRTRSSGFPARVCEVVQEGGERLHRCQFSWWCDGRSDQPGDDDALRDSVALAQQIYRGCTTDPTRGALWYHSTAVAPAWSESFGRGTRIGRHVFYRGSSDLPARIERAAAVRWRPGDPGGPANACALGIPNPSRDMVASG
jgi:hypothetical protein